MLRSVGMFFRNTYGQKSSDSARFGLGRIESLRNMMKKISKDIFAITSKKIADTQTDRWLTIKRERKCSLEW